MRGLSLKSLVGVALQDFASEKSWDAISELHMRGSPESLALARGLAQSRNCRKRVLGMYIASQLRQRTKTVSLGSTEYALEATQEILFTGLHDVCCEVLCAAISGFGHRPHPLALPELIKFSAHPDQKIRFEVAFALGRYSEPDAIEALLHLAKDDSDAVRDWATFSIGSMLEADDPKIRDLLWKNLRDKDGDVRGEALVGLALRKDERIISVLLELLDMNCRVYELEATELIASPLLFDHLNRIKDSITSENDIDSYWFRCLMRAINACSKKE